MRFIKKRVSLAALTLLAILPFQNCTNAPGQAANKSAAGKSLQRGVGGGDGYDGKLTYINRSTEGVCPDGSLLKSKIEVAEGFGSIVRDNCKDIAPIAITDKEIALMPHNKGNAVNAGHVFDLLTQETDPSNGDSVASKFLCRGSYGNKLNQQKQVADVVVRYKQDGKLAHSAIVIMAVYDQNDKLIENLNSGEMELRNIETGVEGRLKYVTPYVGRHMITLWIDRDGDDKRTGKLSFIDLPYAGKQDEPGYNYRDYERVIQDLNCFAQ